MLGNVEKYLLTPIVLRFAKRYIKDAEGAAASDLSVSVSGGSVVFRNFELNLDGVVQQLPCSVVRAFARELQIKIPWTQLSTKPVEVLLDTVECIFKEGTPGGISVVSTSSSDDDDSSDDEDTKSQGLEDDEGAGPGWMASLLERIVANVTVRINNMVCKYLLPGGVISLSCKSVLMHSVGQDLEPGFMDLEGGMRKAMTVTDITVCLDEITPAGTVAGYREPLIRTGACNADVSFTQSSQQQSACGRLNAVLEPLQVSITNKQLQQLQMLVHELRCASEAGMGGISEGTSVDSKNKSSSSMDAGCNTADVLSDTSVDLVSEDGRRLGIETATQRRGAVGHIASAGKRAVSWAWKFLADEESAGGARAVSAVRNTTMKEVDMGTLNLDAGLGFYLNLKLNQGSLSCFSESSVGRNYGNTPDHIEHLNGFLPSEKTLSYKETPMSADRMMPTSFQSMRSLQGQDTNGSKNVFLPTPSLFSDLAKEMSPSRVPSYSCIHLSSLTWTNLEADVHATKDGVQSGSLRLSSLLLEAHNGGSSTQQILRISPPCASAAGTEEGVDGNREGPSLAETDLQEKRDIKPQADNSGEEVSGNYVEEMLASLNVGIKIGWWQEEVQEGDSVDGFLASAPGMLSRNGSKSKRQLNQVEGQGMVCGTGDVYLTYHPEFIASLVTFLGLEASEGTEPEAVRCARKDCFQKEESQIEDGPAGPFSVLSLLRCAALRIGVSSLTIAIESVSTNPSTNLSPAVVVKTGELRCWLVPKSAAHPPALHALVTEAKLGVARGWKENETQLVPILNPTTCRLCISQEPTGKQGLVQAVASLDVPDLNVKVKEEECRSLLLVIQTVCGSHANVHLPSPGILPGTWIDLTIVGFNTELLICEGQLPSLQSLTAVTLHHCTLQILGCRLECSHTPKDSDGFLYSLPAPVAPDMSCGLEGRIEVGVVSFEAEVASVTALVDLYKRNTHLNSHNAIRNRSEESLGAVKHPSLDISVSMSIGLASLVLIADSMGGGQSASQVAIREVQGAYKSGSRVAGGMGEATMRTGVVEVVVGSWVPVAGMARKALSNLVPLDGPVVQITECSGNVRPGQSEEFGAGAKELDAYVGEVNAFLSRAQHVLLLRHIQEVLTEAPSSSGSSNTCSNSCSSGSSRSSRGSCGEVGNGIPQQSCGPAAAPGWTWVRVSVSGIRCRADLWQDRNPEDQTTTSRLSVEFKAIAYDRKESGPQASLVGTTDEGMSRSTCQLSVTSMEVSTCRRVVGSGRGGAEEAWSTHAVVQPLSGSVPVDPLFLVQWQTKGVDSCQVAVAVKPMEWRVDAQLLEELVTVVWERRKNLPKTPGVDVMPFTLNARVVCDPLRIHVSASFPTLSPPYVGVDRGAGAGVVVEVEQSVVVLYSGVEGDVRMWTGIHKGGKEGAVDMNSLRVQGFQLSVMGCQSRLERGSGGPSIPLHPHCDIQATGKLMGCPGPILLTLHTQHLYLHLCPGALEVGMSVVRGLSDAWAATWKLRQRCAGPPTPCDDIRSGAFRVAPVMTCDEQIERGQMGWGEVKVAEGEEGNGGWVAWRYWFPHAVERVVIGPPGFDQMPVAGAPIKFRVCHWDVASNAFVEAGSVTGTGLPGISAEILVAPPVSAEQWQLSWQVGQDLQIPAADLLQSVQVNPRKSAGEGIMPFLALSLFAHQMQVAISPREVGGGAEVVTLSVDKAQVGVHFWGSTLWGISVGGVVSVEYLDLATYTYVRPHPRGLQELLLDPCKIHMAVEQSSARNPSLSDRPPPHYQASALQTPPEGPGCVLSLHAPDPLTLRLHRSGVQEAGRLLGRSSNEGGSVGAFVVHNRISISLAYGQVGGGEVVLLPAGSSKPYSWRAPPSLYPTAPRLLHVGIPFNGSGGEGYACHWCEALNIETEGGYHRGLGVGTLGSIEVVICVERQADATYSVTIGAAYRLLNHMARRLSLQFKGYLPPTFLKARTGIDAGGAYECPVEAEESEMTVVLEPQAGEDLLFMRTEREGGVELEREEAVGQLRVLFTATEQWSEWADLAEEVAPSVNASDQLLSLEGVVEEAESEESVVTSFPSLWLQTCTPSSATCHQVTIAFWPLYSLYNGLCVPVEICLLSDQKEAMQSRVEVDAEVSLDVAQCRGQAMSLRLGAGGWVEQGGGSTGKPGENLWSAPLQFAADDVDKEGSSVPKMGQHCSLQLPHGDGKALSCALVAKDHPTSSVSAVPTISLALLPYALLHNQLPVPVAVAQASGTSMSAWAEPLTRVPFSWRRAPARKARLGLGLGLGLGVGLGVGPEGGWIWSSGVAVDVEGISEVGVVAEGKEGRVEYRFLVRVTLLSEEEVEEAWQGNGYQCCHICVYPWALLSNLSTRNLVVEVGHAKCFSDHPTSLPLTAGTEMKPLLAFPWRPDGICGAAEPIPTGGSSSSGRGYGNGVEGFVARLADGASEEWSRPVDLWGCGVSQHVLLPGLHGGAHTALLKCTTLLHHCQLHLLIHTDPQPQCVIRNDTEHLIEVAGAGVDGLCALVAPRSQLDFRCNSTAGVDAHAAEAGNGSSGEGGQDLGGGAESSYEELLDEALLVHLKKGPETPSLRLRPCCHHWPDPLPLLPGNSKVKTIICAPDKGSESQEEGVLSVRIASLGPTVVVAVGDSEDSGGVEGDVSGTSFVPALSVRVDVKEVRLSMWEEAHSGRLGVGHPVCEEVGVISLEGVSLVVQKGEEPPCFPFLPPTESYRLRASLRSLQAHSFLPQAVVPLVLTSQLDPASGPSDPALQVGLEVCRAAAPHGWWVRTADISSCPLLVNVDDSLLAATCRLLQIPGPNELNGSTTTTPTTITTTTTSTPGPRVIKGLQPLFLAAGMAPERNKELCIVERNLYVENLSVGCVRLVVSVHVTWPWVVDTNRSPLRFSPLHSRALLFPPLLLLRGLLAHYVTEGILNAPQILGSLDLIFNPTGLVRSVQAGLRDLVSLPLAHGFLYGLGLGGMSLIRHVSTWTLTSIAGFSSSLARLLERVYVEGGNPKPALGLAGVGEGFARGMAQLFLSPVRGAARGGGSGLLLGVGKGLAGAIAAPVSSALYLVALTSNGLMGTPTGPLTRGVLSTQQRNTSRTSVLRFERQILAGTAERYLGHVEVLSGVLTTTANQDPHILHRPLLLLTHLSLHAMEYGGVIITASLDLHRVEVSEDPTDLSLTLFSGGQEGRLEGRGEGDGDGDGRQLYVRVGEGGWAVWVPKLRRAIAQQRRIPS